MGYPGPLLEHTNAEVLLCSKVKVTMRVGSVPCQSCEMTTVFVMTPLRNGSVLLPEVRVFGAVSTRGRRKGQLSYVTLLPEHKIIMQNYLVDSWQCCGFL